MLASLRGRFPQARIFDLGGGLGVPDRQGGRALDLAALDAALQSVRAGLDGIELWLEPGRYVVAEAGVLLARVTQLKAKGGSAYVGIATGMNSLIRPALYGAHHDIVNLSRLDDTALGVFDVVGPICESGDFLGHDRALPQATREGDVLLIATAGAYGAAMASHSIEQAERAMSTDEEMDRLHREMFNIMLSPAWSHGVEAAIDLTLVSRFYERFADHAVTINKRIMHVVTGVPYDRQPS